MDSKQEEPQSFSLKILVDRELQKVVVAEATKDFVDTLFSFLTLPLGTIIRLVGNKDQQHPASLGSINNLYQSVENLDADYFLNDVCKNMLLNPRNSRHVLCSKLLVNVDNTEPPKYFRCSNSCLTLSTFANARCTCGRLMDKKQTVAESEEETEAKIEVGSGVFVKGWSKFLVFDDLKVMSSSSDSSLQVLFQLGYRDSSRLEETFINIGLPELLGGNSCVGCVDNLYNSVGSLDKRWCTNSHSVLMDPGVAPLFNCPKQPLRVSMLELEYASITLGLLIHTQYHECIVYHDLVDPRAPNGKKEDAVGFVKRPASYVVGDDLQFKSSMLSFVKEFNLPFDDIEASVLSIGEAEALNLLRASLTSKSALNTGLAEFVKTPKQETL